MTAAACPGWTRRKLLATAVLSCAGPALAQAAPVADHHQHLFSPAMAALLATPSARFDPITARDLVALLDSAAIGRAALLSVAYLYGSPSRNLDDEQARVRAENDWTAAQAMQYPGRLRAFCSFNPLKPYALAELARCAAEPGLGHGLKLHIGNSDVRLEEPAHVEQLRKVFRAANERGMAIALHLRASISRQRPYGAAQARVLLEQLLPSAPDVPVQVAHMAGAGPGYEDPPAQAAMAVLAEAVQQGDPRARQLWFDVATVAAGPAPAATEALLARLIRQVGPGRILYGSDAATGANLRPREGWEAFRRLPLGTDEFARIAANLAPYLR
jgi:predicted TIM-barrel fold metal-dependent hydrolase